jgi:hypothetical protein
MHSGTNMRLTMSSVARRKTDKAVTGGERTPLIVTMECVVHVANRLVAKRT